MDKKADVESTVDNKIHLLYFDKIDNQWQHRYITGTTLSNKIAEIPLIAYWSTSLTANSNDLYLAAIISESTPSNPRLQHYDVAPLAPTGLVISSQNYHPRLDWNANAEPDIYQYIVEKYVGVDLGWVQLTQTANSYYVDLTESYCSAPPPQQCPAGHMVYYRLKAVDLQSHISDPSSSVGTYVQGGIPYKIGGDGENQETPEEYVLAQNYPNTFNPTTTINYSIKSAGEVTLKIYDMLGTEVASLVNESQEAGSYSVEFNASSLPSGIYFYTLTSGSFMDTKKLILLK